MKTPVRRPISFSSLLAVGALGLSVPALADRDHHRGGYRHGDRTRFVLGVDLTPGYYWGNRYGSNYYMPNYGPSYSRYPVAYPATVRYSGDSRYGDSRYGDSRYGNSRYHEDASYDDARVVAVEPILREVRRDVPVRECWDETRPVSGYDPRNGTAGGTILGGLIGGAVGNQIGKGDGRRAATVAGAIIGAAVGHDVAEQRRAAEGRYPAAREETVQRCDTRYESQVEQRRDGYRVTYEYQGRTYQTRLPYDPGERIRIRVAVSPAER